MIDTATLIKSVFQAARVGTSGYQDQDEANRNLQMVELELYSTLIPLIATNVNVQTFMSEFIEYSDGAITAGLWPYPDDYNTHLFSTVNGKPVYVKTKAEIDIILNSTIRKPTQNGPYYLTIEKTGLQFYPTTTSSANVVYYRYPVYGKVTFTEASTEDSDYIDISTDEPLEWPEKAFNILYYSLLEKYGVDCRESIALEYSQLGINKEMSKL
jgi:hypothetical protein